MNFTASFITPARPFGDVCPVFKKTFEVRKPISSAFLRATALGTYFAEINGERVSDFVLAPGWTTYRKRLQVQTYDVTSLLRDENTLAITVGKGWYRSPMAANGDVQATLMKNPPAVLAELEITYEDGEKELILSDESWKVAESTVRFSEIYDGETLDAAFVPETEENAVLFEGPMDTLIPQEGEDIVETEIVGAIKLFKTPKGEVVIDFGQEVTGYVSVRVNAHKGDEILLSHAEMMDKEGNFYTENYRTAKAKYHIFCKEGKAVYKPLLTFFGFRYIRVDKFPGGPDAANLENFSAIVVHSRMKKTADFKSSSFKLNKLYQNILWGQRSNYLDVPTDCPQRNERLGWTGDAEVFVRAGAINFDVEKFFAKWLGDMAADQELDGGLVGHVIPNTLGVRCSAAWGDAGVICPWQIFLAYGDKALLAKNYPMMKTWVDYITSHTTTPGLWTGGTHYGDWLGLDAPSGSYKGSSRDEFIATAYYAYSTSLLIKAGEALGKDMEDYKALYASIVKAFRETFPDYKTQTECVLAVYFGLAAEPQKAADQLAAMVKKCGSHLETGFVGTPYLLHALSSFGYADLAYTLLLREEYPSWLYAVNHNATTMWEHWDGLMENGDFWSADMNSFNHYAYGAVADWMFGVMAGITTDEDAPGYARVRIAPMPDERLDWIDASIETRHGLVKSSWRKEESFWRYEITTPVDAEITVGGATHTIKKGSYIFYSPIE
ncbi:MAG: glycoside hydrolase family 78 protein [Clostridia bacterium]|nr:glycoside hydrolase family 78 protein [Clostridia bacterium]